MTKTPMNPLKHGLNMTIKSQAGCTIQIASTLLKKISELHYLPLVAILVDKPIPDAEDAAAFCFNMVQSKT